MKDSKKMQWPEKNSLIKIQAHKYDGQVYRQWNMAKVLEVNESYIVTALIRTKVSELNEHKWIIKDHTIFWFPLKSFYNVIITKRKNEKFYYINLSSPPIFEDNTLKFIDFDLDVKIYPKKDFHIIDKKEHEINKIKYQYPEKLDIILKTTIEDLRRLYEDKNKSFIFIRDLEKYFNMINDMKFNKK